MIELTLNDKHEYHDQDGKIWPSVTQIIQVAGLANQYNHNEYAATRGTFAHKGIHLFNEGVLDEDTLDDTIKPYIQSYKKHRESRPGKVFISETIVFSSMFKFAGKIDQVIFDGKYYDLEDNKTGVYDPGHGLQSAAYVLALKECMGITIRHRYGVHLKSNGSLAKLISHDDRTDKSVFLSALNCVIWKKNKRGE